MRGLRQFLSGLAIALASSILILGGLSLSLAEGRMLAPTMTLPATATPTWVSFTLPPPSTATPIPPSETPTPPPTPTTCPPPFNWIPYQVQAGDTLESLAQRYRTSPNLLAQNNCLLTSSLPVGFILYVPPLPLPTATPCRPPRGWVTYIIQQGDTLSKIAARYGIRYPELQAANCLTSTIIYPGQRLYVPPWPPFTLTPEFTLTLTSTPTASETFTASPSASSTPEASPTFTATATPSQTPTVAPTPSATPSPAPSATPTTPSP